MDGEAAFLASLGQAAEYDPSHQQPQPDMPDSEGDEEEEQELNQGQEEEEDDDDYDPSSFMPDAPVDAPSATASVAASATPQPASVPFSQPPSQLPSQAPSRTTSTQQNPSVQAAQKPKTIGGFIEEEDDDDDEDDDNNDDADDEEETRSAVVQHGTNGALAVASQNTPLQSPHRSVTHTPSNLNTQVYTASKDLAANDVVPNGPVAAESVSTLTSVALPLAVPSAESVPATPVLQPSAQSLPAPSSVPTTAAAGATAQKPRLPQDRIGQLEDRIKEDPKADISAWLELINLHRQKGKLEDARQVYDRFFEVFPTAGEQWVAFANMELEQDDFYHLEQIFNKALLKNHNIQLWSIYLDYIRRRNNVMTDTSGQARTIINAGYEFVLNVVGIDKDSAPVWRDYIDFIKSGPGNPGGNGWQDAQKMDTLRKAYQRAVVVPHALVQILWKEYDLFETGLNKMTGRKTLQEKSPAYMTARGAYTQLQNITRDLKRTTLPSLPPAPGFDGDEDYLHQVEIWRRWIQWEREEDPLALKDEDIKAYRDRIIYAYRQAVMALRFWPQIWYDAAEWCYGEAMDAEGDDFLAQGAAANPESCLLAFKRADRIEQTTTPEDGDEGLKKRGDALREPYDTCLTALYGMINKAREREPKQVAQIEDYFASLPPLSREPTPEMNNDDDEENEAKPKTPTRDVDKQRQIDAVKMGTKAQIHLLSKLLSNVWVALMRAFRRTQGKGKPDGLVLGLRGVFAESRKRGRLTSDVYVAAALLEHHCYKDVSSTKIFERGIKLFPEDEAFALEYLKHLIAINDITNARAVFETTVSKLTAKPETVVKSKPLYLFMHDHESQYGDMSQITKLEKRMADLFPEDASLSRFAHRFRNGTGAQTFDPCVIRPVISPSTQMRPKQIFGAAPLPSIEQEISRATANAPIAPPAVAAAAAQQPPYMQSPKRPLDSGPDSEAEQPARKLARGESPLKGAAGRRQQQRQRAEGYGSQSLAQQVPPQQTQQLAQVQSQQPLLPRPLPREVNLLLSIIPGASTWSAALPRLDPERMVSLIQGLDLSRAAGAGSGLASAPVGYAGGAAAAATYGVPPTGAYGGYGYGR